MPSARAANLTVPGCCAAVGVTGRAAIGSRTAVVSLHGDHIREHSNIRCNVPAFL